MKFTRIITIVSLVFGGIIFGLAGTASAAPTIDRITSPMLNSTYRTGADITLVVDFSESVYSDGDVVLNLNSSSTASCVFSIASSSPVTSKSCIYTVREGDFTNDLDVLTVVGSIFSSASSTPMTDFVSKIKLASNRELVIDTSPVPPTILSTGTTKSDGVYGVSEDIQIDVVFSEPIYSVGDIKVNLNTGRSCNFSVAFSSPISTGSCVYTTQINDATTKLDVSSISGNIFNASSTPMIDFMPAVKLASSKDIIIDGVSPSLLSITTTKSDGDYTVGEEIPIILNYSEPVVTTDYADLGFNSGGSCRFSAVTTATTTPTCIYTIASGENTNNLDVLGIIGVGASFHLYDEVGNETVTFIPSNSFGADYNIVIDTLAPVAVLSNFPENPTYDTSAQIVVGGSDVDYYMYSLDSTTNWSSARVYSDVLALSGLSATTHTIYVVGSDSLGNWQSTSTPSSFSWTIASQPVSSGGGGGGGYIAPSVSEEPEPQVLGVKIYSYSSGRRVKVEGDSAVYHITDDGKRHLYVNEVTYWTWHKGIWADQPVETISQEEFDNMPEGEHVTVQPGTKLIRFFNSPRVYMVSEGSEINYMNEAVLTDYYGDNWEDSVIMIQNGFESDYKRGNPVEHSTGLIEPEDL